MARTDKTRPYWVRIKEAPVEVHDHRDGFCNIAGVKPSLDNIYWQPGGRCHYDGDWGNPEATLFCGCHYCSGRYWNDHRQPRVIRRAGKRAAREWWREY